MLWCSYLSVKYLTFFPSRSGVKFSSPWIGAGIIDMALTNTRWRKWHLLTSEVRLQKVISLRYAHLEHGTILEEIWLLKPHVWQTTWEDHRERDRNKEKCLGSPSYSDLHLFISSQLKGQTCKWRSSEDDSNTSYCVTNKRPYVRTFYLSPINL